MLFSQKADVDKCKIFLFDIGITEQLLQLDLKGWFLQPKTTFINQRELVESFVGQEIMAYSAPNTRSQLYYWQRESRGSEAEVDYLVTKGAEVIPIEVKAGKGSTLKSLHSFLSSHPNTPYGIKLSLSGRSSFEKIVSIPLYATFEIVEGGIDRIRSLLT